VAGFATHAPNQANTAAARKRSLLTHRGTTSWACRNLILCVEHVPDSTDFIVRVGLVLTGIFRHGTEKVMLPRIFATMV
jgi:hypothetical protein